MFLLFVPASSFGAEEPPGRAGSVPPRSLRPASPRGERRPAWGGGLRRRPPPGFPSDERSGGGCGGGCCRLWAVPCGESLRLTGSFYRRLVTTSRRIKNSVRSVSVVQVGYESPHPHMRVPGLPASLQSASGKPYADSSFAPPPNVPLLTL